MTFTARELEQAIVEAWVTTSDFNMYVDYEGKNLNPTFDDWFNWEESWYSPNIHTRFGKLLLVTHGRDKDSPSIQYVILECDGRYFRVRGYYDSWNGGGFEDPELVEVEKATRIEEYWEEK